MWITKRRLQLALGVLWVLDGALQLQPALLTPAFAGQVIRPVASGQPAPVAWIVSASASVIAREPLVFGLLFGLVQLAIGIGLLFGRSARLALAASIPWAFGVWVVGEGLGGILGGGSDVFSGAPGAALLYVAVGLAAWPRRGNGEDESPARRLALAWSLIWLALATLQLLPGHSSNRALAAGFRGARPDLPGLLAPLDAGLADATAHAGSGLGPALAAALVCIAAAPFLLRAAQSLALAAGALFGLAIWVFTEAFGGIATGLATDPNTGPLLVLLAAGTWSAMRSTHWPAVRSTRLLVGRPAGLVLGRLAAVDHSAPGGDGHPGIARSAQPHIARSGWPAIARRARPGAERVA